MCFTASAKHCRKMYKKITQGGKRKMHKKDNSEKDIENKSTRRKNKNLQKTKGRVERILTCRKQKDALKE